jgi:DNA modification methylase
MADLVLDPFLGSGTTAIASESYGRSWIGIDISTDYCKLANDRIKAARRHKHPSSIPTIGLDEPVSVV